MKNTLIAGLAVALGTLLLMIPFLPSQTEGVEPVSQITGPIVPVEIIVVPSISEEQATWKHKLALCESGNDPSRINPKDRDGTPSIGLYQFKPSTLTFFAEAFNVPLKESTTTIMTREAQDAVLDAMLLHYDKVEWLQQFPDCIRRIVGMPPRKEP